MIKIYKHLFICQELKNIIELTDHSLAGKLFLNKKFGSETIKIHSWREGDTEIKLNDILYIHSANGSCFIHLMNGTVINHKRAISFYQKIVDRKLFIRVHQSYLINLLHLSCADPKHRSFVIMSNNEKIPFSPRFEKLNQALFRVSTVTNN
ncbi:MAG: LytTR family DNA-binding domain-containing protein [Bacteroidota bacterium]